MSPSLLGQIPNKNEIILKFSIDLSTNFLKKIGQMAL